MNLNIRWNINRLRIINTGIYFMLYYFKYTGYTDYYILYSIILDSIIVEIYL